MDERALFRALPQVCNHIPWVPLAHLPTPVEPLPIDGATDMWIKRDDYSGSPYGGNKVRKLEFLLGAAKARGARRLITVGAAGSHHALATAIYGRALGFDVTLVLFPQPLTPHVRDTMLLDCAYGAELRFTRRMETVPAALFAASLRYRNQGAYIIPAGGSDAIGTLGYVDAALELAEQVARGEVPAPASVVIAAGTLGSAAGLALGFEIGGLKTQVKAIRITSRIVANERALARLIRGAEVLLNRAGAQLQVADRAIQRVEIVHGHIGTGYGRDTAEGSRATALFARMGVHLDPTYTAKAAGAFMQYIHSAEKPVLFWQTLSAAEPVDALARVSVADLPAPFRDYLAATPA